MHVAPYAFHSEYSTANPVAVNDGRKLTPIEALFSFTRRRQWQYLVTAQPQRGISDEIGHFENCLKLDANFNCIEPGRRPSQSLPGWLATRSRVVLIYPVARCIAHRPPVDGFVR